MGRRIGLCFLAFLLSSYTIFLTTAISLNTEKGGPPSLSMDDRSEMDTVLGLIVETLEREMEIASAASVAIRSIIAGAASETTALADYIIRQNGKISPVIAERQAGAFIRYSRIYDIPLDLAVAVANTESHFKPEALSSHGSAGVMQVTWKIHERLLISNGFESRDDLFDPVLGIKAGCLVISHYMKMHKSPKTALGRYYGGSAEVYWSRISKNLKRYQDYERTRRKS